MARKKMRKFAGGDEIVVQGKRPMQEISTFDLARIGGNGGMGGGLGSGMAGMGGGASSQRLAELTAPAGPTRSTPAVMPAVVRQPQTTLGNLAGARAPKGYGASFRMGFAEGGKAKAKPVKKMAKGGSTASKRADGCATKGKTKGRFV